MYFGWNGILFEHDCCTLATGTGFPGVDNLGDQWYSCISSLITGHELIITCEFMHQIFFYFLQRTKVVVLGACIMVNKKCTALFWNSGLTLIKRYSSQVNHNMLLWFLFICFEIACDNNHSFGENNVCGPSGTVDSRLSTVFYTNSPNDLFISLQVTSLCSMNHQSTVSLRDPCGQSVDLGSSSGRSLN